MDETVGLEVMSVNVLWGAIGPISKCALFKFKHWLAGAFSEERQKRREIGQVLCQLLMVSATGHGVVWPLLGHFVGRNPQICQERPRDSQSSWKVPWDLQFDPILVFFPMGMKWNNLLG